MPIEITLYFIRPSLDIPWFTDTLPSSHFDYIRSTYANKVQGKIETDSDGMIQIIPFTCVDDAALQEFINDEYLQGMIVKRDAYNLANGIISSY